MDLKQLATQVAEHVSEAGAIIRTNITRPKDVNHKGRIDLVTETDLAVELFLKERLAEVLPGSSFLAEETSSKAELVDDTWIIDPLDGTTNFAHGLPMVATSVGLWRDGQVVLGVINLPILNEIFVATLGGGATMNGVPISVSGTDNLQETLVATGFPYDIETHLDAVMDHMRAVLPLAQGVRRPGAAALDLVYVACGRYDAFYESALHPWDTAAGLLLVREAGGRVTEYDGGEYGLYSPTILATNGAVHQAMIDALQG